jgi:hypothetical protein
VKKSSDSSTQNNTLPDKTEETIKEVGSDVSIDTIDKEATVETHIGELHELSEGFSKEQLKQIYAAMQATEVEVPRDPNIICEWIPQLTYQKRLSRENNCRHSQMHPSRLLLKFRQKQKR